LPGRLNEAHEEMRHIALKMARHLPIHVTYGKGFQPVHLTGGYCWSSSNYRSWCAQHAFLEGKKAAETAPRKVLLERCRRMTNSIRAFSRI
jgi:hypothetical protein